MNRMITSAPKKCAASFFILATLLPVAFAQKQKQTAVKPDSGKFHLIIQENEIGTDAFTISDDGVTDSHVMVMLGTKTELHTILTRTNGRLSSVMSDAGKSGRFLMTITGNTGIIKVDDKPFKDQKLPDHVYPLGNFSPQTFAFLIEAYNRSMGGAQHFDMIATDGVGPDGLAVVKVTLTLLPVAHRTVAGKPLDISRFSLVVPGAIGNVDTEVDTDSDGKVLLWSVPGQKYVAVREGYEDLKKPERPEDPLLSPAKFGVSVDHKVMIAMRDGVKLAADIYRPDVDGKYPVILQRTPYGRTNALEASSYAKRGFVFVAQDVRGRFDSEGDFHPFVLEAKDGYDSVEWCANQPWSTGNVGMIGGSYLGFVQWAAAREGNPHLKCLIPIVSPPDPFFNVPYMFGELFLSPDLWWASAVKDRNSVSIKSPVAALKSMDGFKTLPLTEVDKAVLGEHIPFFQEWLKHSTNDAYYDQVNWGDRMASIGQLPALHVSGWFDGDGIGTKRNYAGMVATGHSNQKLIYGPWSHAVNTTSRLGHFDFGPKSLRDLDTLYLRWFDRWLKGVPNGVEHEPMVDAFIMGKNEWRTFDAWPPSQAAIQKWYFHSNGKANSTGPGGSLSTVAPGSAEPTDRYLYDPADPYIPGGAKGMKQAATAEPGDDSRPETVDHRQDCLVYSTPTLKKDVVVAGPISLHLSAATSAKDTDWFAMLQDVLPDGQVDTLCQGIIRARFRKSFKTPQLLKPGEIADYVIDLWALGNDFKAGHRIRVVVSSSFFPVYARNLNTGGDIATDTKIIKANQTVYHTHAHPSYLELPVLAK